MAALNTTITFAELSHVVKGASQMVLMVKHPPAMQETQVRSLGREDPLEEGLATLSSILAWKIPWQRRLVGYSPWRHIESDTTE